MRRNRQNYGARSDNRLSSRTIYVLARFLNSKAQGKLEAQQPDFITSLLKPFNFPLLIVSTRPVALPTHGEYYTTRIWRHFVAVNHNETKHFQTRKHFKVIPIKERSDTILRASKYH